MFGFDLQNILPRNKFFGKLFERKVIQSVCYDSKNKNFIVGFSHKDDGSMSTLVRMKDLIFSDSSVISVREFVKLGHCNDMEYRPDTHKVYVVRGDNIISIVNPETLEIEKNLQINTNAWSIARYSNGDFFIHDGNDSRRFDCDFKNVLFTSRNDLAALVDLMHIPYDPIEKTYAGYWQGAVMINDVPHVIYTEWNGVTDQIDSGGKLVYNGDARFSSCILYDTTNKKAMRCKTFQEAEGACIVGNQMFVILGSEYIGSGVYNMDAQQEYFETFEGVHREIPTGASLNQMFTPGRYRSKNAGKTKTLKNLPNIPGIKEAGMYMEIINVGLNHIRQTIYSNNFWSTDIIVTRGYSFDYGWGPWYKVNMTAV